MRLRHALAIWLTVALGLTGCGAADPLPYALPGLQAPEPGERPQPAVRAERVRRGGPAQQLEPAGPLGAAVWADALQRELLAVTGQVMVAGAAADDQVDTRALTDVLDEAFGAGGPAGDLVSRYAELLVRQSRGEDLAPTRRTLDGLAPASVGVPEPVWAAWGEAVARAGASTGEVRLRAWLDAVDAVPNIARAAAEERLGNWPELVAAPVAVGPAAALRAGLVLTAQAEVLRHAAAADDQSADAGAAIDPEVLAGQLRAAGAADDGLLGSYLAGWAQAAANRRDAAAAGRDDRAAAAAAVQVSLDGNLADSLAPLGDLTGLLAARSAWVADLGTGADSGRALGDALAAL